MNFGIVLNHPLPMTYNFLLLRHLSPCFTPVRCSLAPLRLSCESWFTLKLVPVDLHLFCVLLFGFNSAISAALCCLFAAAVRLQSKLEVGEGVGAQAGPCVRGARLPFGAHAAALQAD
jgi:hypothetical protein